MNPQNVVMIGATGAVGGHVVSTLLERVSKLTLLGRRESDVTHDVISQHVVDLMAPETYTSIITGHDVAICTLGVGEPSKVDKATFVRVDKEMVLDFARACRSAGVKHFSLLSSVGVDIDSRSFYLCTKGELEEGLRALEFERLSLFHPSMILTPTNRYGIAQAITLKVWPVLSPVLRGSASKYRGIPVETLGQAMALNVFRDDVGEETLHWDEIMALAP